MFIDCPPTRNREEVLSLAQADKIPIGVPVDNTRAYLLDENLNPVESGQRGRLYIAGAHLCGGFVSSAHLCGGFISGPATSPAPDPFSENRYENEDGGSSNTVGKYAQLIRMGDVCSNKDGRLYFEGRLDSQVHVLCRFRIFFLYS